MSDFGLSNERTTLSWQRTALSLVTGAAVVARLTVDRLGIAALVTMAAAMALALWISVESARRYQARRPSDGSAPTRRRRGGRAAAALTLVTIAIAGTELAAILSS